MPLVTLLGKKLIRIRVDLRSSAVKKGSFSLSVLLICQSPHATKIDIRMLFFPDHFHHHISF
jgi:hypothetical protein